jgi:hypothetical protein
MYRDVGCTFSFRKQMVVRSLEFMVLSVICSLRRRIEGFLAQDVADRHNLVITVIATTSAPRETILFDFAWRQETVAGTPPKPKPAPSPGPPLP